MGSQQLDLTLRRRHFLAKTQHLRVEEFRRVGETPLRGCERLFAELIPLEKERVVITFQCLVGLLLLQQQRCLVLQILKHMAQVAISSERSASPTWTEYRAPSSIECTGPLATRPSSQHTPYASNPTYPADADSPPSLPPTAIGATHSPSSAVRWTAPSISEIARAYT